MTDPSPDLESDDIKSMGLYHHVDRVVSEVRDLGRSDGEPLRAGELTAFDQLHYHGTEAVMRPFVLLASTSRVPFWRSVLVLAVRLAIWLPPLAPR